MKAMRDARPQKIRRRKTSGGSLLLTVLPTYAFDIAALTASAVIGSARTRAPEAL